MRFLKVEGAGNDYVLVDAFRERCGNPAELSIALSDRHTGVGSDGLLLVGPPSPGSPAAAEMRMFNADGSEGRMCGNGLRCVVRWLVREGRGRRGDVLVQTAAGLRRGRLLSDVGEGRVEVSMGRPSFHPEDIPARLPGDGTQPPALQLPPELGLSTREGHAVSVGNPHLVVRVSDPASLDLAACGRPLEHHAAFPDGVNAHFVALHESASLPGARSNALLEVRPWERGSGATRACGTGAVAVSAVARALGWSVAPSFLVEMPGGRLEVRFDDDGEAWLIGPARLVFQGEWASA
ncbi:MAG: diaminopimelate epimerase [Planctomycetota bacterium]|nr:MAG: diaminopimelate epimerase [Planctomycetota bacterium]